MITPQMLLLLFGLVFGQVKPTHSEQTSDWDVINGTSFAAALQHADVSSLIQLRNITKFTVIVPSDQAIAGLEEQALSRLVSPGWYAHLHDLLLRHFVEGEHYNLIDETGENGKSVSTLQGGSVTLKNIDFTLDSSNSAFTQQTETHSGVFFFANRVLQPPSMTESLYTISLKDGRFSILLELLSLANLEQSFDEAGPMTIFAPTDDAWGELDPALLSSLKHPSNKAELLEVLARHVVWEQNLLSTDWIVGDTVSVLLEGDEPSVTAVNPTSLNGNVNLTTSDVLAKNGVLHVVDKVILPADFQIQPKTVSTTTALWAQPTDAKERLDVVALGDSFIAGNGARDPDGKRAYEDTVCYRSDYSWVGQYATCVADSSGQDANAVYARFNNHACSGARVADVYDTQISGVTSETDLVFLSTGPNDADFPALIVECYFEQNPVACKNRFDAAKEFMAGPLLNRLTQLLIDIRSAGHEGTKVVLVGGPYMGNDPDFEIETRDPVTGRNTTFEVAKEMYAAGDMLNDIQRAAVLEANKVLGNFSFFESTNDLFRGREFDVDPKAENPGAWLFGFDASGTLGFEGENFHYNWKGHEALGEYLCTRSDYGASQPIENTDNGFSKSALLAALFLILIMSLIGFCLAMCMRSRTSCLSEKKWQRFSRSWSETIRSLHLPIKRLVLCVAQRASTNPTACITLATVFTLTIFACGLATNFNIVSDQEELWTPRGSRTESQGSWVEDMMPKWSTNSTGNTTDSILLTVVVHANGENVVSKIGAEKMFEVLNVLRETPGYDQFCAVHGVDTSCPSGYEYMCTLYGIPISGTKEKDCQIEGATAFWFHNRSLFEEQVLSDADVSKAMSLDIPQEGGQSLDRKDVFGYPEYEDGLLVSSAAFVSLVSFPQEAEGAEDLRRNIVQALHGLQEEWEDDQFEIQFLTTGSFSDEFLRSIEDDIVLFPVVFLFMSVFTCLAFAKRDPINSRSMLGLGAVFTILLSILTGYGILFTIGVPLTSLTQVLPFVCMGIGLDDSFLIKNAFERSDSNKTTVERIRDVIEEVGISIAMTSLTSSLAFALGCTSSIPAVRWLCLYGFVTIMVDFFYQCTVFLALVVLDEKRIEASRRDILCCFTAGTEGNTDSQVTVASTRRPMILWSNFLLRPATKAVVILAFSALFAGCAVATTRLELGFDFASVLPSDSYVISFTDDVNKYTQRRIDVDLYFRDVDQGNMTMQEQMKKYVNELVDGVDAIAAPPNSFWVTDFHTFVDEQQEKLQGVPFNKTLQLFLQDPRFHHEGSLLLDEAGNIVASKAMIRFDNLDAKDGKQVLTAMKAQAKVASEQSINMGRERLAFFSFNAVYYLWDFLIETEKELILTTAIGVASVSAMSLLFLPHWTGVLFVLPMIISLYVDMMGVLHLAGIDINGVSFVSIVMSLGLYVDYILHVLLCYYESNPSTEPTREERVKKMLSTIGVSVLLGGLSTLFGALPLAFTSSEVFYTVFVSFVSIVALGLGHGLILLPVLLSLVGPTDVVHNRGTEGAAKEDEESQSSTIDEEVVANKPDEEVLVSKPENN